MSEEKEKFVSLKDFGVVTSLLAFGILSILVPVESWKPVSAKLASLISRLSGRTLRSAQRFQRMAYLHPAMRQEPDIGTKVTQMYVESRLQITDQYLVRKWKPSIQSAGIEHILTAQEKGKGVILWVTPFAYSDLIAKMGLSYSGIKVSHLSRPSHGFSNTRLGMATINKLRIGIENKYIKDRIWIRDGEQQRAMLELRRVLKGNGVASITVSANTRRPETIPLGDGELKIATGAIRLSQMTGAPILPVFAVNTSGNNYIVDVADSIIARDSDISGVLTQYAETLERYIAKYAVQWRGIHDFGASCGPDSRS